MTAKLKYLLKAANGGNAEAAYKAAVQMEEEGFNRVIVQTQFHRSAEGGYPPAQRWLGILALLGKLLKPDSVNVAEHYYSGYSMAVFWLGKAAANGDKTSAYLLAKCRQLGLGLDRDEAGAEEILRRLVPFIPEEQILNAAMLFDKVTRARPTAEKGRGTRETVPDFLLVAGLYPPNSAMAMCMK